MAASEPSDETRQHRRIQNRICQRARRRRIREAGEPICRPRAKFRQYQVTRWRLDEAQRLSDTSAYARTKPERPVLYEDEETLALQHEHRTPSDEFWFPLPADHLLHLVKFNVFRGLLDNKVTLSCLTIQSQTANIHPWCANEHVDGTVFPSHCILIAATPDMPNSLHPTQAQMTIQHWSWIDVLPFPSIRDRLIIREKEFDHADFVGDLVGDLLDLNMFSSSSSSTGQPNNNHVIEETSNVGDGGLIVWGEPHLEASWEATPAFLSKWAWAVRDCSELIISSNLWRESRGEAPIILCEPHSVHQIEQLPCQ